jgi:hypothetical protein
VGDWGTAAAAASAFVGLLVGYFIGYRSGEVAGELKALKSTHHRNSRRRTRHEDSDAAND